MKYGASEGIRTLDVHLGKVMLYQTELRSRSKCLEFKEWHPDCKISFLKVRTLVGGQKFGMTETLLPSVGLIRVLGQQICIV